MIRWPWSAPKPCQSCEAHMADLEVLREAVGQLRVEHEAQRAQIVTLNAQSMGLAAALKPARPERPKPEEQPSPMRMAPPMPGGL